MRSKLGLLAAALLLASLSLAAACGDDGDEQEPLKIGLLLNFGEGAAAASTVRQQSFELAIQHINDAGGVLGDSRSPSCWRIRRSIRTWQSRWRAA